MKISFKQCYFGIVAVLIGFILNNFNAEAIHTEEGLELLFRQRYELFAKPKKKI